MGWGGEKQEKVRKIPLKRLGQKPGKRTRMPPPGGGETTGAQRTWKGGGRHLTNGRIRGQRHRTDKEHRRKGMWGLLLDTIPDGWGGLKEGKRKPETSSNASSTRLCHPWSQLTQGQNRFGGDPRTLDNAWPRKLSPDVSAQEIVPFPLRL